MKFLFTMEWVGEEAWKNRRKIVNKYFEIEEYPFVEKDDNCGYSAADFQIMQEALQRAGVRL